MLSISSKVALAIGITLSVAAISSIFVTMVAVQNLISSSSSSQSATQPQQLSQQNTTSSSRGESTGITSTITIPEGAAARQVQQYYLPNSAEVAPSSQVVWDNEDTAAHTATADDSSFDTGIIQPASSGSATVPAQGTVPYFCTIHPFMRATLQVSSSSSAGGPSSTLRQDGTSAQLPSPTPP